jgi:hypothetical protein
MKPVFQSIVDTQADACGLHMSTGILLIPKIGTHTQPNITGFLRRDTAISIAPSMYGLHPDTRDAATSGSSEDRGLRPDAPGFDTRLLMPSDIHGPSDYKGPAPGRSPPAGVLGTS